jgi:NADH-quinone oxidoreductase subunit N
LNAPLIWILIPEFIAITLFFLRRWYRSTIWVGVFTAAILALLAWQVPLGENIDLGPWSFKVDETFQILGRSFILTDRDRPILTMIYLAVAFWFGAIYVAKAGRMFVPLGLGMVALLIAALAVEPFLYAAILLEMAVLLSVPILLSPGKPIKLGILRFVTFQTLGMPFFLFTNWMLTGVESSPGENELLIRAGILLGLGFMFLLAIVPFHSWVLMLAEGSHPYAVSFVLIMLSWMVFLFGIEFLDRYSWLRNLPVVFESIRLVGILMVISGGIGVVFQRHLGRILGFAVLVETGFTLLAMGLPEGLPVVFMMFLPRALSFGVWSLALAFLRNEGYELTFDSLSGGARKAPVAAAAIVLAQLSIAGFPLLAGFPLRWMVWDLLASLSQWQAMVSVFGSIGLFASALRTLTVLVTGAEEQNKGLIEPWQILILLGIGIAGLFLVGLFPQWLLPSLADGLQAFRYLAP